MYCSMIFESERLVSRIYLILLLVSMMLYWLTAQDGVAWQDSGLHQFRVLNAQFSNPLGLALSHPLYILICQPLKLFTRTDLALWINRLSGIGMALAVANVYYLGFRITGRHAPSVLASLFLMVCHTAWWLSTIAESYSWVAAGLSTELIILLKLRSQPDLKKVLLLGLVNGLGVSLHNFALLSLPVHCAVIASMIRGRELLVRAPAIFLGSFLIGSIPYLVIIIDHGIETGAWLSSLQSALFGSNWRSHVMGSNLSAIKGGAIYVALSWPFLSLVPVLIGYWTLVRKGPHAFGIPFTCITLIHLVFAMRYPVPDQFMFFLPSYSLFAVAAAVGIRSLQSLPRPAMTFAMALISLSLILTPVLYAVAPQFISLNRPRTLPGRDETRYWISPWKCGESSAQKFAMDALSAVEPNAVIMADDTTAHPIALVQQLFNLRPDVRIENEVLGSDLGDPDEDFDGFLDRLRSRPLYLVSDHPKYLPPVLLKFELQPVGPLFRVLLEHGSQPETSFWVH